MEIVDGIADGKGLHTVQPHTRCHTLLYAIEYHLAVAPEDQIVFSVQLQDGQVIVEAYGIEIHANALEHIAALLHDVEARHLVVCGIVFINDAVTVYVIKFVTRGRAIGRNDIFKQLIIVEQCLGEDELLNHGVGSTDHFSHVS